MDGDASIINSISCNKSAILNLIFSKTKWEEEMASLGFTTLFIGVDLERFDENGSVSDGTTCIGNTPVYLALGLVTKECPQSLTEYPRGFPKRDMFFDCLRPWKWANERQYDILIEESNIELNISEYYRRIEGNTLLTNPSDVPRLIRERPNAVAEKLDRKHIIYALSTSDENPRKIVVFYYTPRLLVLMPFLGADRLWQFWG